MTKHRTKGQQRAMWELCALARTALDVCDLMATRAEEHSDAPRHYLASLERWTRGEETGAQLAARTRAQNGETPAPDALLACDWWRARVWLIDARNDLMRNPGHTHHTPRVCLSLARTVGRLTGDPPDAATLRVRRWLDVHRADVAREVAEAKRMGALAQAKTDKVTAEHALGTLPGVE